MAVSATRTPMLLPGMGLWRWGEYGGASLFSGTAVKSSPSAFGIAKGTSSSPTSCQFTPLKWDRTFSSG